MDKLSRSSMRADLHVHSKYSDRPSEWFLRRIGAPESFVEPDAVYRTCRERGMDFVTITDHNSICGVLEIAERPGVFLSAEMTTYFPEDRCKLHCLVWGISEAQFRAVDEVREDVYALRNLLVREGIAHGIAHPLFRINDRLSADHLEKLLLLFSVFEGINGARDSRADALARAVFEGLTPEFMVELAGRHGIEPTGPDPHVKRLTGGSDDHSGLYIARAHTVTPQADDSVAFLNHLRAGRHSPAGVNGTSKRLAHSLIHIAYSYYAARFAQGSADRSLIGAMLRKLSAGADTTAERPHASGWRAAVAAPVRHMIRRARRRRMSAIERDILDEFAVLSSDRQPAAGQGDDMAARHFRTVCRLGQGLGFRFAQRAIDEFGSGRVIEGLQSIASLVPVLLGAAPYVTAFGAQHKDEAFLRALADRYPHARRLARKSGRRAWVTDTFAEVNGVAHTIRTLSTMAVSQGREMTVVTSMSEPPETDAPLHNFRPVGSFRLPEYRDLPLTFPPFLDMLAWFEEQRFDEILISTPGPVGLCALCIGRLLGLPIKGIYHTDLPRYVQHLTEDESMADLTRRVMRGFYGGLETVFVPCEAYRKDLVEIGLDPERLRILPRGVDLDRFHPGRRDERFWELYGRNGGTKYLYAGRVSREKNLDAMLDAYCSFASPDGPTSLLIVGDGPAAEELRRRYARPDIVFTGFLEGDTLAAAVASADVFVFPSRTDTFGNAVLEAQACGLPAIVAEEGGPREIVSSHDSGLVVDTGRPEAIAVAMRRLGEDRALCATLRERALARARAFRWEDALDLLYAE